LRVFGRSGRNEKGLEKGGGWFPTLKAKRERKNFRGEGGRNRKGGTEGSPKDWGSSIEEKKNAIFIDYPAQRADLLGKNKKVEN